MVDISRRDLFKITGLTGGGLLANSLGFDLKPAYAASRQLKISNAKEFKTVCPYCAVSPVRVIPMTDREMCRRSR